MRFYPVPVRQSVAQRSRACALTRIQEYQELASKWDHTNKHLSSICSRDHSAILLSASVIISGAEMSHGQHLDKPSLEIRKDA